MVMLGAMLLVTPVIATLPCCHPAPALLLIAHLPAPTPPSLRSPAPAPAAAPASLVLAPGGLCVARLRPSASGGSASSGPTASSGPAVVVSCRVGALGVYNLPCYF